MLGQTRTLLQKVLFSPRVCRSRSNSIKLKGCQKGHKAPAIQVFEYFEDILKRQSTEASSKMSNISDSPSNTEILDRKSYPHLISIDQHVRENDKSFLAKGQESKTAGLSMEQLQSIDDSYCRTLNTLSYTDTLQYLMEFIKVTYQNQISTIFYDRAIEHLKKGLVNNQLNKHEIVLLLYIIGMDKVRVKSIHSIMEYIPDFSEISLFEQCIVAETCFRGSLKLTTSQQQYVKKIIECQSEYLISHMRLLIMLCKAIRLSNCAKDIDFNALSSNIVQKQTEFPYAQCAHILFLYAEACHAEPQVLNRLVGDAMTHISTYNYIQNNKHEYINDILSKKLRSIEKVKYLTSLLYGLSRLNYNLNDNQTSQIIIFIQNKLQDLMSQPGELATIMLSLWILNIKMEKLVKECFNAGVFEKIIQSGNWKMHGRLHVLLNCIEIELPHVKVPEHLKIEGKIRYYASTSLKTFAKIMRILAEQMQWQDVQIHCPVKGLSIAGITLRSASSQLVHIDLLDESTCLKGTRTPHGFMSLKLRLLKQLGYRSILVDNSETRDTVAIFKYVEDTLSKKLCEHS